MSHEIDAIARVRFLRAVNEALPQLTLSLRVWLEVHLIVPRAHELCTNRDHGTRETVWLITDHTGAGDAPFRIVFDGLAFGLEITLEDGVSYLVHRSPSLVDAVECL